MTLAIQWSAIALVLACAGALTGALLTALFRPAFAGPAPLLGRIEPALRYRLLATLAALPLLGALATLLVAFGPSLLHIAGVAADHCGLHRHGLHLCFLHSAPPPVNAPLVALSMLPLAILSWRAITTLGALRSSARQTRALLHLATFDDSRRVYRLEAHQPLAISTGIIHRRILIAADLEELLTPDQLHAVITHERAHHRRRDGLRITLLTPLLALHLPGVGAHLGRALHLAMEQACDEEAARAVNSRLTVAEALLAVERAHREQAPSPAPSPPALSFDSAPLRDRIEGLLHDSWARPSLPILGPLLLAVAAFILLRLSWLHHLLEHALALFI